MTPFEEQLQRAMARREPPPEFTSRVLARVAQEQGAKPHRNWKAWLQPGQAWRLAGAMTVLLTISGSVMYQQRERMVHEQHEQRERQLHEQREQMLRGEAAKEKLLTALGIAGVKLHQAHRHVLEVEAEVD